MPVSTAYAGSSDASVDSDSGTCPECGGKVVSTDVEAICRSCQLVLDDAPLDHSGFIVEDDSDGDGQIASQHGPPVTVTRHDRGISSEISWSSETDWGEFSQRQRNRISRLKREDYRSKIQTGEDKALSYAFREISRLATTLGFSETITEQSSQLFRTAHSEDLLIGRSIEGLSAGSLYAACRCNQRPITLDELAVVSTVSLSRIRSAYQLLNRELSLPTPPPEPKTYVPPIASEVNCTEDVRYRAMKYAKAWVDSTSKTGKPTVIAAACLYAASRDLSAGISQYELQDAAGVTRKHLRKQWQVVDRLSI